MTTKGINKRVMWLQQFLDELQRDKMLRSFELFIWFFSATDRGAFEKKRKELTKIAPAKTVLDIKHFGAKANVSVTAEKVVASQKIANFVPLCQTVYDKLAKATEDRIKVMRVLSEAYAREADIYRELALAHATVNVRLFVDS